MSFTVLATKLKNYLLVWRKSPVEYAETHRSSTTPPSFNALLEELTDDQLTRAVISNGTITGTSIQITWTKDSRSTSWVVVSATDPRFERNVVTSSSITGTATYTRSGLTRGVTYYFKVISNGNGHIASTTAAHLVITPTYASAPIITSITPGATQLSIAFTAPTSNGGSAITNYKYSINDGASFVAFSPADTTSPLVITGLTNGVEYEVSIKAVTAAGDGAESNGIAATPHA